MKGAGTLQLYQYKTFFINKLYLIMKKEMSVMGLMITALLCMSFQVPVKKAVYQVVPLPQSITLVKGQSPFLLSGNTIIRYAKGQPDLQKDAQFLASYIKEISGLNLKIKEGNAEGGINLLIDKKISNQEGYKLEVNSKTVNITGATGSGVFYGIQTLRKALPVGKESKILLPAVQINDYPRFAYRGAMLDVSRHFFPVDSVKQFIDMIALHNINRMHWHLSDDQGWRIEIKCRPELVNKGSKRTETVIGHNSGKYDGIPYSGYYTQEQVKGIVKYAAERNIIIIPEIDMPGHMQAALKGYPELGCTGGPYEVWTQWGISDNVLCAGNDKTLDFIDDVLGEIVQIFPSKYIHVGGDECPKSQWAKCPKCQARIKTLGIQADAKHTAEEKLQSYIISHAEKFLNSKGRQIIGWDEILEGGLAPNATVMSWRGESGGIEAAKQHHDVIMTPNTYLYFDYYQSKDVESEPMAIGGYLPIERVYSYEPMPASLTPDQQKYIKGVQANLWTEYIPTYSQVEYMELPRMAALSEVQWTNPECKNYQGFMSRMPKFVELYKVKNYHYAKHIFDVNAEYVPNVQTGMLEITLSTIDSSPIFYTLDGTTPTAKSTKYTSPIQINRNASFRAVAIRPEGSSSVVGEDIHISKASMKPITMLQPINKQYEYKGAPTLNDGLKGKFNYKTGRWIAFNRNDMEAVIDLQKEEEISKVAITTCVEKGDWVFDAKGLEVSVSDDGKTFRSVASESYPAMTEKDKNQLYDHAVSFAPVKTRFVKVKAMSEQSIPQWHGGKGHPGFLFVDEITVD